MLFLNTNIVRAAPFLGLPPTECLYQDEAASEIERLFDEEFVYINNGGSLAIDVRALHEFRNLTEGMVVWETGRKVLAKEGDA